MFSGSCPTTAKASCLLQNSCFICPEADARAPTQPLLLPLPPAILSSRESYSTVIKYRWLVIARHRCSSQPAVSWIKLVLDFGFCGVLFTDNIFWYNAHLIYFWVAQLHRSHMLVHHPDKYPCPETSLSGHSQLGSAQPDEVISVWDREDNQRVLCRGVTTFASRDRHRHQPVWSGTPAGSLWWPRRCPTALPAPALAGSPHSLLRCPGNRSCPLVTRLSLGMALPQEVLQHGGTHCTWVLILAITITSGHRFYWRTLLFTRQ